MKRRDIQIFVFMMIVWVMLNETIRPIPTFVGILCSIYSIRFTNRFLKVDFAKEFDVNPLKFIGYCFYIIKEIYLAGFDMLKRIIAGDVHPVFMHYESNLKSDLANVVLANSITSTPGTITIHREEKYYIILSANQDEASVAEGLRSGMEPKVIMFDERQVD